ncbi:MAG TPA: hypothetical protein VGF13_02260 [Verrucomicrobiae bacterium]
MSRVPTINSTFSSHVRRSAAYFAIFLLGLFAGCRTGDTTSEAAKQTNFRVGHVYQLKVPAYLLAGSGLVMTVAEAAQRPPAQAEALLEPGTYFKVRQVVVVNDRAQGPRTEIYAEIVSGPRTGRVVNLRTASLTDGPPGTTRRNPAVFEPFLTGR